MSSCKPQWVELLIFGFIHDQETKHRFSMSIPNGIILYIINYFPILFKFGLHDKNRFAVSEDKMCIKGIQQDKCDGYTIYADLYDKSETGFNRGIHYWSIKALPLEYSPEYRTSPCYRNIGITTARNEKIVSSMSDEFVGHWTNDHVVSGYHYYYDGCADEDGWGNDEIITVKMDCDDWKVSYYKELVLKRTETIEPYQYYFFALSCCVDPDFTSLTIVETPQNIKN